MMTFGVDYNVVDFVVVGVVALEIILGARYGLARALFRLTCTGLILLAALRSYSFFGGKMAAHLACLSERAELSAALAFALTVILLLLFFLLLHWFLRALLTVVFNEKINHKAGALVGALQGLFLSFLLIYAVGLWPHPQVRQYVVDTSYAGRAVFKFHPVVIHAVERAEHRLAPLWEEQE